VNWQPQSREQLIQTIRNDQTSGAAQLAALALQGLQAWLGQEAVSAGELNEVLDDLKHARPSMVALTNALDRCQDQFDHFPDPDNVSAPASDTVARVLDQLTRAGQEVAKHAAELVPDGAVILTHSRSSQILQFFQQLVQNDRRFSVICTQSSPGNEGFTLAEELDQLAIEVTVITDAQLGLFVPEASLAVVGCDTWLTDNYFVNKSGTYLLALAAREHNLPVWVLADSFKQGGQSHRSVGLEEMAADQIGAPEGVHIHPRNIYFECVPARLVSGRVTERGASWFPAEPGQ
jgi:translation initiation factor 2B subunit (eIF-2B alpha/beta/delta family)